MEDVGGREGLAKNKSCGGGLGEGGMTQTLPCFPEGSFKEAEDGS